MQGVIRQGGMCLLVAVFCFGLFSGAARAVETETIGVVPAFPDQNVKNSDAWFIYGIDRGQSRKDAVKVINNKNETVVMKLYAVDAAMTSDGSFALLQESDPRQGVGSWVKLAANELELPAHTAKVVPFVMAVPQSADSGDQMGGIVIEEMGTNGPRITGSEVRIVTRVGVRIYERVPGTLLRGYSVTGASWQSALPEKKNFWTDFLSLSGRTFFEAGIKNEGNTKLTPLVTVEVKNIFGRTVGAGANAGGQVVFPNSEAKQIGAVWNGIPLLGRYKATLTVSFPEQGANPATRTLVIWAFPYRLSFWLIALFVIFVIVRLTLRYAREARKENSPLRRVRKGDTLEALADKFLVSWKTIARYNEIKKPFELKVGSEIFIPLTGKNKLLLEEIAERGELKLQKEKHTEYGWRKNKYMFAAIALIIVAGGSFIWWKKQRTVHQEIPLQNSSQNGEAESDTRTAAGAVKPSSVKVGIYTAPKGDKQSTLRLIKKFQLIGYAVSGVSPAISVGAFAGTTILYAPGKIDAANTVKSDLDVPADVAMVEAQNLGADVVVANKLPKENFVDIGEVITNLLQ